MLPGINGFRFSGAPMMDWTGRRCRAFHRHPHARHARLYTEMVTADARSCSARAPERLIGFDASEHAVALQLGGAEPGRLAEAARIGADFGYLTEINLNCGCPSDRVQSGRFGACLMREPKAGRRMRACLAMARKAGRRVPVTGQVPDHPASTSGGRALLYSGFAEAVKAGGRGGAHCPMRAKPGSRA